MRPLRRLQPALAAFLAACVLLLGLAAWSPALHAELCPQPSAHPHLAGEPAHDHEEAPLASSDHACAVTLFASGCLTATPPPALSAPVLHAASIPVFTERILPRIPRGPVRACGPPTRA
jgi:hypothetical protein